MSFNSSYAIDNEEIMKIYELYAIVVNDTNHQLRFRKNLMEKKVFTTNIECTHDN